MALQFDAKGDANSKDETSLNVQCVFGDCNRCVGAHDNIRVAGGYSNV